jgi:hypothetical protein
VNAVKLNHFICPSCGHDFYCDAAYATCDACQRHFYASESLTSHPSPLPTRTLGEAIGRTPAWLEGSGYYPPPWRSSTSRG